MGLLYQSYQLRSALSEIVSLVIDFCLLCLGDVFNKTIIPLALVGCEIIIATGRYAPRWLSAISCPTRARGIFVKYRKPVLSGHPWDPN